jgi:NAD(P)-dependent dehydrogenase (short-subunit alcohol dehydrogenase family)
VARRLLAEGAQVVLTDADEAAGRACAEALGPRAAWRRLDVRVELSWIAAMAAVLDGFGRLDVLVNGAGVTGPARGGGHDPEQTALEDWHALMRCNLDGVFLGCKHGLRTMRRTRAPGEARPVGTIINLPPRCMAQDAMRAVACAASQAAVCQHTRSVAQHCAEERLPIRCHAILPGHAAPSHGGRFEALADIAVLLASDAAAFANGSSVDADGGPA